MQVPPTPRSISELDLMKRLQAYAAGKASWLPDGAELGKAAKEACQKLLSDLTGLTKTVAPLLDRVTAKEMDTFTMHDRQHAIKVAHLMWHILDKQRRARLTPPEIALLVAAAFIHDLGMFLSNEERDARLYPESDLWTILEIDEQVRTRIEQLRSKLKDEEVPARTDRIARQLVQAEEALLCQDTRERHALRERYEEILSGLKALHAKDSTNIPDIDACLAYEGDSFRKQLIDVCVSHGEDADALLGRDAQNPQHPRFPRDFPLGSTNADLHLVAATLRLADILDFDRERTPPVIYHYFLPGSLDPAEDRSTLEWEKHMAISNWEIGTEAIVFRGRCHSHIVHHAIVLFCDDICDEISATRSTFDSLTDATWPFVLPPAVKPDIHEDGYHYVPYKFELDDDRVYKLLMGGAIYSDARDAVRELIQNAVDACRLRDALTQLHQPETTLSTENRVFVDYTEPTDDCPYPLLSVRDTGTGMDNSILDQYFLKVGRSYYNSREFNKFRAELRQAGHDFAPVSEFGIGFLACFLLADKVLIETAMWEPLRGDNRKRTLEIHGPTRLIRLEEQDNSGMGRFYGTRVTLTLTRGHSDEKDKLPPTWEMIEDYLRGICLDLPYRLHLRHHRNGETSETYIDPRPLSVQLPPEYEEIAIRIPVNDTEAGLEGEIALIHGGQARKISRTRAMDVPVRVEEPAASGRGSSLLRGGFRIGTVDGFPNAFSDEGGRTIIRLTWEHDQRRRFALTNLARKQVVDSSSLTRRISELWLRWLLENQDALSPGFIYAYSYSFYSHARDDSLAPWLEEFSALQVYQLGSNGWSGDPAKTTVTRPEIQEWEQGGTESLPLPGYTQLAGYLLGRVLSRVTGLELREGQIYVQPPCKGWQAILEAWNEFETQPVKWAPFAEYSGGEADMLYSTYQYGTFLSEKFINSKFASRLQEEFTRDELDSLVQGLEVLGDAVEGTSQQTIRQDSVSLLERAQQTVGELCIGGPCGMKRLDEVKIPSADG